MQIFILYLPGLCRCCPLKMQLNTLCYLRQLLNVFGSSPELISVPDCGRSFVSMMSSLADAFWLGKVLQEIPICVVSKLLPVVLMRECQSAGWQVKGGRAWALQVPWSKSAEDYWWSCLESLRLPFRSFLAVYVGPASLLWTDCPGPAFSNGPNLRKEDYDITFELVRLWDVKGLAFLLPMQKDGSWPGAGMGPSFS